MTRRPKLSLVPDKDPEKKQMPELGPAARGPAEDSAVPSETPPSESAERPRTGQPNTTSGANQTPASATQIVKIVLVVAATALSLYLLKRRFF